MPDGLATHDDDRVERDPIVETPGEIVWDEEIDGYSSLPVRLYEIPEWRDTWEEKWMEIYDPSSEQWTRVKKHWTPVLEGLIAGESLAECEARLEEARPDFNRATRRVIVRKVVRNLERAGMAKLVLPEAPEVFAGRFERIRQLGRGGMGIVWLCRDLEHEDQRVAVKHAWNWKTSFEKAEASIREEAKLLARFDTPRIVSLVDTFDVDGRFHMAREFLDGQPLSAICGSEELTEARRIRFARQIAEVVDRIWDEGLLFFDISPANFYVDRGEDALTLGDLGVTRKLEDGGVEVGSRIGTRRYAAPEMMGGGRATERSQVYALGRVYWHMVMGRIPVSRSSVDAVRRQNRAILELLRDSRASPREVEFFDRATRIDPDERPATLDEALAILEGDDA